MSSLTRFLARLADLLERASVPYMLTGSVGSVFHGEPRSSRDVDVVAELTPASLECLLDLSQGDDDVSSEEAREALDRGTMFNVIDLETGWKAGVLTAVRELLDRVDETA